MAVIRSPDAAHTSFAEAPRGTLVELSGVGRRYRVGANEAVALADVSLRVAAEDLVVVLGPSGSGKTTLLNIIGALDSPSEGRVVVAGQDITRASRRELFEFRRHGVSFVFQTFNLFPALTSLENVEFGADAAGREHVRELAHEMLDRVSLSGRAAHFPHELSGGEQQRVSIARALESGNPILLPDEPYAFTARDAEELRAIAPAAVVDGKLLAWYGPRTARLPDLVAALRSLIG